MCGKPPTECLDNYDDFDLDDHRQRRLATYALEDYYGTVLSEYGREYLDLTPGDTSQGIGPQWNKAKSRIRRLNDVDIPDEYSSVINRLHDQRNTEVAHDYQANPSLEVLEEARTLAEEWADWFVQHSESYAAMQEEQTAEEMVEDMVGSITDSILSNDTEYFDPKLQEKQELIDGRAEVIREELAESMEMNGLSVNDGVDKELIQILLDAVELRNDQQSIESTHRHEMEKIERQEAIRRKENTYRCIVVDDYDEDVGTVHVITHEHNKPDISYTINVPEFPEHEQHLKNLDVNDELRIEVDRTARGREFVQEIV